MKSKSLCFIAAGLAAIVMTVTASAATLTLQSFEDSDLSTPQATSLGGGAVAGSGAFSTIGVSQGTMSYSVQGQEATAGAGAKVFIRISVDAAVRAAIAAGATLHWETTIPEDDDPNDAYTDSDSWVAAIAEMGGYMAPGGFNIEDVPFDGTTVTTNVSFNATQRAFIGASAWTLLDFGLNSFPGVQPTAYFDNFRLEGVIPEPTSLALLGLGVTGLALIRRR